MTDNRSSTGTKDALDGLAERLDRLCLTSTEDGRRFVLATESAKNIVEIVREWIRSRGAAQAAPQPVQDTYLVGGPDLKAMSGSVESDRVIQLHFRRKVTDADRKWLLEAINAKIAAEQASPVPSTDREGSK